MPKLGDIVAYTITTPDLEGSLAFYKQLGFVEVMRADWPFPWIQVTDGVVLIMLRKDDTPYMALTYYVKNIDKVVKGLTQDGIDFVQRPAAGDKLKRYVFATPDGALVSLVNIVDGFRQPEGKSMLHMDREDYYKPDQYHNKVAGMFGEYAQPVKDLKAAIAFWQLLGFEVLSEYETPYPWAILSDGVCVTGLHQTAHFTKPALTYFAADMDERIVLLKQKGLAGIAVSGAGNAIVATPEGQQVFLYNMGGGKAKASLEDLQQPVIATERLLLKEINPELLTRLHTSYSDEDIVAFLGLTSEQELATEKSNFSKGLSSFRATFRGFLLMRKDTGRIIGKAGYHTWSMQHNRGELGYIITDEASKGQGYMKEALAAIIDYGFEVMALNRIEALVGPNNEPSLKLVRGFGFKEEGLMRAHYLIDGIYHDSISFSLLRNEYEG